MALLTADDVLNKDFDSTKFREGYDQDQVDEFLDEVVATLNALYAENAELRSKLNESEQRVAELTRAGAAMPAAQAPNPGPVQNPAAPSAPATTQSPVTAMPAAPPLSADTVVSQVPPAAMPAPAPLQAPNPAGPSQAQNALMDRVRQSRKDEPESATQMLALAQRLHDEYVRSGQEEGEKIISAAKAQAAGIVREAEEASVRTMGKLEQERSLLERKIEELRLFERDYRTRLKSYLENLLTDLEGKAAPATPSGTDYFPATAAPAAPASGEQPTQWSAPATSASPQRYRPFGG